jgi:hypothetical protein
MMIRFLSCLIALIQLAAWPSFAQGIKPGLWEINNQMTSADAQTDQAVSMLLQHLGNLPPDQRNMVQQIAASQGVTMPRITPGGRISVNACVTPEMAASKQVPNIQQGDCTSNNVAIDGGMKMAFVCSQPQSSGEGRLSFIGDTAFTMTMNVTSSVRGRPEQAVVDSDGRWLGHHCPPPSLPSPPSPY